MRRLVRPIPRLSLTAARAFGSFDAGLNPSFTGKSSFVWHWRIFGEPSRRELFVVVGVSAQFADGVLQGAVISEPILHERWTAAAQPGGKVVCLQRKVSENTWQRDDVLKDPDYAASVGACGLLTPISMRGRVQQRVVNQAFFDGVQDGIPVPRFQRGR